MRQRNTTGGDLFVQGDPGFTLAPDEVVDHEHHIPGCEYVAEPVPAEVPVTPPVNEAPKSAPRSKTKVTETEVTQ